MHARFAWFCLTILAVAPLFAQEASKKVAPPNADQIKQAQAIVDQLYKKELVRPNKDFGRRLLKVAQGTTEDIPGQYVLFRKAVEIGAMSGDSETVYSGMDALETGFEMNVFPVWAEALEPLSKRADVSDKITAIFDRAYRADDYDSAAILANLWLASARNAKDLSEVKTATAKAKEVPAARDEFKKTAAARQKLEANPTDPDANRIVGSFLCFFKMDWEKGVPMLALGDDTALKKVATLDLEGGNAVEIADAWNKIKGGQGRALYWYKKALPELSGLPKARVEKLLQELGDAEAAWNGFDISQATLMNGFLRIGKGEKEIKTKTVYGEFDVTVVARTEKNNIRIRGLNGSTVIFNWETNPRELRITRPDGSNDRPESGSIGAAPIEPLIPNRWYTLRWVVAERGMKVFVNGVLVFSERRQNHFANKATIDVHACDSDVDVKSFVVSPVQ